MVDPELLEILVCPETRQPVTLADEGLVASLNAAIREGRVSSRGGETVHDAIEAGLVREDRTILYPVRDDIPIMLVDESIPLDSSDFRSN